MSKDPNQVHTPEIGMSVILDRNVSAVWVSYEDIDHLEIVEAVGSAKRHPGDVYNPEIALQLATSRALRALSGKLLHRVNRLVSEADAKRAAALRADKPEKIHLSKKEWLALRSAAGKELKVASVSKKAPAKKKK